MNAAHLAVDAPPLFDRVGEVVEHFAEVAAGLRLHADRAHHHRALVARHALRKGVERVVNALSDVRLSEHPHELGPRRVVELVDHQDESLAQSQTGPQAAAHQAQHQLELIRELRHALAALVHDDELRGERGERDHDEKGQRAAHRIEPPQDDDEEPYRRSAAQDREQDLFTPHLDVGLLEREAVLFGESGERRGDALPERREHEPDRAGDAQDDRVREDRYHEETAPSCGAPAISASAS